MPLTRSKVVQDGASIPIEIYGETLNVVYYPSKMNDDFYLRFAEIEGFKGSENIEDAKKALAKVNEMLVDVVKSWDFYEEEDKAVMVPITVETFAGLELPFKFKILYAIIGDVRPEVAPPQIPTS